MNGIALRGFRERWQTYVGAVVTVALGVGLVQASLLLLLSVLGMQPPAGADALTQARFDGSTIVAVTVVSVTLGFAAFLAVFIIASTFAFSVDERRRDLALLRIVGAEVGQVRRMLRGEALILGLLGAAIGVPAGVGLMQIETRMLVDAGFVPQGFAPVWQVWIVPASVAFGVGLAFAGVTVAARRAARIEPLDAVRAVGAAARPMTRARWTAGLGFSAATVALVVLAPAGGLAGGQAMAMSAGITAALAITMTAPALVPVVATILPRPRSAVGVLAFANLRDARSRSASTATPLIVLLALVLSQPIAMSSFTDAATAQIARGTHADLVLESSGSLATDPGTIPGVVSASTEWTVPVRIQPSGSSISGMPEDLAGTALPITTEALVMDPGTFATAHPGAREALQDLGRTAAAPGPGAAGLGLGDAGTVSIGDRHLGSVRFGTPVPAGSAGQVGIVVRRDFVPADILEASPATTFVEIRSGADRRAVSAALADLGSVTDMRTWVTETGSAGQDQNAQVLVVVMAVGALYAVIGILNAVAIAASGRRQEFAVARASGMTRAQVLTAAALETLLVAGSAVGLALTASVMTVFAVLMGTAQATGAATLDIPWPLVIAAGAGGLVLTGVAGLVAAAVATRQQPAALLSARG
ncbi:FtsX-like permease family protein [Curtobacterium sp. MCBD17_030]|uniref:ABC transporter permease n=1 Tax=Curtobacterium sp. MCBD17_030 TaxID=2175649 RepID=UPI000D9CB81A|nr:FtsX-like permease family protein [Curtobacterium sp. MCBD17_030]PYY33629.1 ABC transporter permease [Curtobacterium sp. MCBD17_030]